MINNAGEVVFLANGFSPGFGVFTAKDLVVGVGDTVDGKVITDFNIAPPAVNDRGDIAIRAFFQDGSAGILLARRATQ
jgi:hypothetical protein